MYDWTETTAYYFVIPRSDEANPFSDFTHAWECQRHDLADPEQQSGHGHRNILDTALKLDYSPGYGTFTSITDYNHTQEIDTGDAYDFRPVTTSVEYALTGGAGRSRRPVRRESEPVHRREDLEPGAALHLPHGGGLLVDRGCVLRPHRALHLHGQSGGPGRLGVPAVYYTPLVDPTNPFATNTNQTFLADSQSNNAWAVFADATYEFTPQWELDAAIRYDEDHRQNTTDTPTYFLPTTTAFTGEVRNADFCAPQPKATLRYKPNDDWTFYGGWSRGFRSGGFNQTGVGAVAREPA